MATKSKKYSEIISHKVLKPNERTFNKLVNIILYIIKLENRKLYLTRLLKLLYIIDEKSVIKIGSPITNLDYKVAEKGPLADHLWYCVQNNPQLFSDYFEVKFNNTSVGYSFNAKKQPDLNILSDFEDDLIKETIKEYKGVDTEKIIKDLHNDGTLWYKITKKHNLNFQNPESSSISKYTIDFKELIKNDDFKLDSYENYLLRKPQLNDLLS